MNRYNPNRATMSFMEHVRSLLFRIPLTVVYLPISFGLSVLLGIHVYLLKNTSSEGTSSSDEQDTDDPKE